MSLRHLPCRANRRWQKRARQSLQMALLAGMALPALADEAATAPADEAITVTAQRLDSRRDALLPALGANVYTLDRKALETQPQGDERSLQRTLLQTPGVSLDNFGQVHVRNEHANLQYRLNGVIVPEPISGFGQVLDVRFADSVSLITGALPAQYGYRTAGVVDIKTRNGLEDAAATFSLYGGSNGTIQPAMTLQGASGGFSGFGSLTFTHTDLGIENPIPGRQSYNNQSDQLKGFAYLSQVLSPSLRLSAILGAYQGRFGIPAVPGQAAAFTFNGQSDFDSSLLADRQREHSYYGTLALQYAEGPVDLQIAPFFRLSRTRFIPDVAGDLIFNGIADQSRLSSDLFGVQADGRWQISGAHTLRFGTYASAETTRSAVLSQVFALNGDGSQLSDQPLPITDAGRKAGQLYGAYLQDEWHMADPLTVNFGVRYDRLAAFTNEGQLSPRINAVLQLTDNAAFHIGYMRTFTPPPQELIASTNLALYAGTTKAPALFQNDPVRAEREHVFDAGFNIAPAPGLTLVIDGYYKSKRNLLDEGQFGEALVLAPFNYARGYNYGVEIGAQYRRGPLALYANIAAAEQRANDIISSQFFFGADELSFIRSNYIFTDHTQKLTGSAGASYRLDNGAGALTLAADMIYGSGLRRDPPDGSLDPNGSKLPAYAQVNLGIAQAFNGALRGFTLRLDVINLLDHVYQIRDGTGVGISAPQFGPRRAAYVGISKRF